jgi:benzodiazapine receptor
MNLTPGQDILLLVGCVAIPLVVGGIGGWVTTRALATWYGALKKPNWNPPNAVFGPVWTLLYILMGVSLWRLVRLGFDTPGVRLAVSLFALQLALNLIWSLIFFGRRAPGGALAEIVLLWAAVWLTVLVFAGQDALAGWLLVPYGLWTTFATVLNFAIWRLNRSPARPAG